MKGKPRLREFHARTYVLPGLVSLPRVKSNARSFAKAVLETPEENLTFIYGNKVPDLHVWKLAKEVGKDKRKVPRLDVIGAYEREMADYEWVHEPYIYF